MADLKKQQLNRVTITGTLVENKLTDVMIKTGANAGKNAISGEIVIKCLLDGSEQLFPIRLFTSEVTAEGKPSKLYTSYKDLAKKVGSRITVSGSLSENRFWSEKTNNVASAQTISGRFISDAKINAQDEASFEISGFVARELTEKVNKENEIYAYEMAVAQYDYKEKNADVFKLHVSKDDVKIANAIMDEFVAGTTVHFYGNLRFLSETISREVEMAFGSPTVSNYEVTNRYYFITGAAVAIADETAYTEDDIKKIKANNTARDLEIQNKGANTKPADAKTPTGKKGANLL